MPTLSRLFALLTGRERAKLVGLAAMAVAAGLAEMAGVASILPFLQLVSDPAPLEASPFLASVAGWFGLEDGDQLLLAAGGAVLAIIALSNLTSATTVWLTSRFAWGLQHRLATRLLSAYLGQPYPFYLGRNTAELGKNLLIEVNHFINSVLQPLLRVLVRVISALFIVGLLAVVNWQLSLLCVVVLGGAYGLVYVALRKGQGRLGQERFELNAAMFRVAQESLSGIKTVKTFGREAEFVRRFEEPSHGLAVRSASHNIVARVPRYVMETVAFGGIVLVVLYALRTGSGMERALPVLGLYAFAAYRLLPSLNEIFNSSVGIRFNAVALDSLHDEFTKLGELPGSDVARSKVLAQAKRDAPPLPLGSGIRFDGVTFSYEGAHRNALSDVSFGIAPDDVVGFAGSTGAGKTTLVDLLLGLLAPTEGSVLVDDAVVTPDNAHAWRLQCGYVPQDVFLSDQSIAANIAFGVPEADVSRAAVERAAEMAQLMEFVDELPDGLDTLVGERGVRLSGGQRQRIGIARALYGDPQVLVFDEATSALDGVTEAAVLETVLSLAGHKTLILIAHRLTTLKRCDIVHLMSAGEIEASGTYDELHDVSERFRAMAQGVKQEDGAASRP